MDNIFDILIKNWNGEVGLLVERPTRRQKEAEPILPIFNL
jgi:hypothetical protein